MANIEALRQEALDRAIEDLKLRIEAESLEMKIKTERMSVTKDKEEKADLKEDILWSEHRIAKAKLELETLSKMTPEQYVAGRVTETIEDCNHSIERKEKYLSATQDQPDEDSVQWATNIGRSEIEDLIAEKKIKAPLSEKKREQFVEDLLQTPEYQEKIQKLAQESTAKRREDSVERIENEKKLLSIANPESEEFLQYLINCSKDSIRWSKAEICGLDISRIFEMPKGRDRYPETFDDYSILKVVAQIPPEEYLEKVRPKLIRAVESVLSEFKHDERALLAKKAGVSVATFATYFVGGPILGALGAMPGVMAALSTNSEAGTIAGVGLAALGGIAGLAGAIAATQKLEEKADSFDRVHYEAYVKKEIERILTEEGYMQKEGSESAAQPGQE